MAFEIHQPLFGLFSFDVFTLPRKQMIYMYFEQLTYRGAITSADTISLSYFQDYKDPNKTQIMLYWF